MPQRRLPEEMAPDAVALGHQIRERRDFLGWSQDDVVKKAKHAFSKETLQRIEGGVASRETRSPANPGLSTLVALCEVLGGRFIIDVQQVSRFRIEFVDDGRHRDDPRG